MKIQLKLSWYVHGQERTHIFGTFFGVKEMLYWQKRVKALLNCKVTGIVI